MGRLGSEVRVSVSFQSFALRMFVYPIMYFCRPLCQKGHFSVPLVLQCFRDTTQWRRCAVVRRCVFSTDPLMITYSTATMGLGGAAARPDPSSMYQI